MSQKPCSTGVSEYDVGRSLTTFTRTRGLSMRMGKLAGSLALLVMLVCATAADADHSSSSGGLSGVIPNLFGRGGVLLLPTASVGGDTHQPHFSASSEQQLTVINDSLRGQLSTLPLPSPASG